MPTPAYTRSAVLQAVQTWLEAVLTDDAAEGCFDAWFDIDNILVEPVNGPGLEGPYFTVQDLTHAVRDGTGDPGGWVTQNDFVHSDVVVKAVGDAATEALAFALHFWGSDDSYIAQETVRAAGFIVIPEPELDPSPRFLETGYDIYYSANLVVGCLRTRTRVTDDTNLVVVTGNVDDDLAISVSTVVEAE